MGLFLASQFVVGAKVRFEICQSVSLPFFCLVQERRTLARTEDCSLAVQ